MAEPDTDRYALVPLPPRLAEYQQLRRLAGLPPRTDAQGAGALRGSWAVCHLRAPGGAVPAMGRVVGDGGWYFTLADVVTHPDYRSLNLTDRVLEWLLTQIRVRAPKDPYVTVVANAPTRGLYEQAGFRVLGGHGPSMLMAHTGHHHNHTRTEPSVHREHTPAHVPRSETTGTAAGAAQQGAPGHD